MAGNIGAAMSAPPQQAAPAGPPPLPSGPVYYAAIDGRQAGPFDLSALQSKAAEGKLRRETLVWKQGMPAWAAAGTVPDLEGVLGSVPPALPS